MSKKSETKNEPWKPAQGYILQGLQNSGRVFDETQPQLEGYAGMQRGTYGRLAPGAEAGISAAQRAVNANISGETFGQNPGRSAYAGMANYSTPGAQRLSTLGDGGFVGQGAGADYWRKSLNGDYLNGDSNFNTVVANSLDDVERRVNARFGGSGAVGQTAHSDLLARNLAATGASLRSQNYQQERSRQDMAASGLDGATRGDRAQQLQALGMFGDTARGDSEMQMRAAGALDQGYNADMARQQAGIGQAQDLMRGSQGLLDSAAQLPWYGVGALNGNVRQASNGYGTTTTRTSDPAGFISGLAGAAATAYASDERLKNVKGQVGADPKTGLPIYDYTYKDDPAQTPQTGVMAQDVAKVRPDAVGQSPDGSLNVDYGALGLPGPGDMAALKQDVPDIGKSYTADGDRRGFQGWLDRTVSPDASTTRGKIGILGQYLMAQSGSPFEGLGKGLIGARQEGFDRADTNRRLDIAETQAESLVDYRNRPLPGANRQPALIESLLAAGIDPSSPEGQDIVRRALPGFGYTPAALDRKQGDAMALVEKRAALRPAPAAPRPAAVRSTKVIGGKPYYNIGGRWFDNAEGM